jgi:ketosteroid isomerase-like protein
MITGSFAAHFARDWIEAWNAHDLDRVLGHYDDDFEMTSPLIVSLMSEPSGTLRGKTRVRAYWARALERRPGLKFELKHVTFGVDSLAIHFQSETGRSSVDWMIFGKDGKVAKSYAHHEEITELG